MQITGQKPYKFRTMLPPFVGNGGIISEHAAPLAGLHKTIHRLCFSMFRCNFGAY